MEAFSGGYYMTNLLVTPYTGDRAVLSLNWFDTFQQKYVRTHPLVFKVNRLYIPVYGESSVPDATLALPSETCEELGLTEPEERAVFLAKKHTVENIISSYEQVVTRYEAPRG